MHQILTRALFSAGVCSLFTACTQSQDAVVSTTANLGDDIVKVCMESRAGSAMTGWVDFSRLPNANLSTFEGFAGSNNMRFSKSPNPIPNAVGKTQTERVCPDSIPEGSTEYYMIPIGSGVEPYIKYDIRVVDDKVKMVEGFYRDNASARKWQDEKKSENK